MRAVRWWESGLLGGLALSLVVAANEARWVRWGAVGEAVVLAAAVFAVGFVCGVLVWAGLFRPVGATRLPVTSVVLGAVLLVWAPQCVLWCVALVLFPPMDYVVTAEFRELPESDKELAEWLRNQPGVYIAFVDRKGSEVTALWGYSGNTVWQPVTPDLRGEFERLGYKGLLQYREEKSVHDK
jgi:hypothetical protein